MINGKYSLKKVTKILLAGLTMTGVVGCTSLKSSFIMENKETTHAGAGSLFQDDEFEELNLCNTLIEFGLAKVVAGGSTKALVEKHSATFKEDKAPDYLCELVMPANTAQQTEFKMRRNEFVTYLMGVSEQRCGNYKNYIVRDRAKIGTWLGGLTAVFAGTATVLTHEKTIRLFAAGAGATSSIDAVYEQERYANLAAEVITAGINTRRKEIRKNIEDNFKQPVDKYPIRKALAEGLRYHAACNAVTGFEVAHESIERQDTPTLDIVKAAMEKLDIKLVPENK